LHLRLNAKEMIPSAKKISELTWGEIITDLDERYWRNTALHSITTNAGERDFINVNECAALTGYSPGYIRQLVFKRAIPFHKNPKLKPVRFKRVEILDWMASKKFTPITEQAENYIEANNSLKKSK
jgi:predicted DNA-binding transcriptional regulator AlpA